MNTNVEATQREPRRTETGRARGLLVVGALAAFFTMASDRSWGAPTGGAR